MEDPTFKNLVKISYLEVCRMYEQHSMYTTRHLCSHDVWYV